MNRQSSLSVLTSLAVSLAIFGCESRGNETIDSESNELSAFPLTLEAENMPTKTTGTAFPGGWDVWDNGYVEQSVTFPSTGAYTFDVVAAGHEAAAVWPVMELRIDGHASGTLSVSSTSFGHYHLTAHSIGGGAHRVALAFTNYAWVPPEERALLLDKITIAHDPGIGANGSVLLSWVAPSARADGTPLTDLAGYVVHYGTSSKAYTAQQLIPKVTSYRVTNLNPVTYFFAVTAIDSHGAESELSNEASRIAH